MKKFGPSPQLLVTRTVHDPTSGTLDPDLGMILTRLNQQPTWQTLTLTNNTLDHPDIKVINLDQTGIKIEQVRTLIADSAYPPYHSSEKVVALLHLEQASLPAQQALLKFLEEPPVYLRVFISTNQLEAVLPTIQSRCQVEVVIEQPNSTTLPQNHSQLIEKLLNNQLSINETIALAEIYSERLPATLFLQQLIDELRSSKNYPTKAATRAAQVLTDHWQKLHHNTNVRLTMESCFFAISRF